MALIRRAAHAMIIRASGITVALGIGILVLAAFQFGAVVGMIALGLALIAAGLEVPRR